MTWLSWIASTAVGLFVLWIEGLAQNAILDAFHTGFPSDPLLSAVIFVIKGVIAIAAVIKVYSLFSHHPE